MQESRVGDCWAGRPAWPEHSTNNLDDDVLNAENLRRAIISYVASLSSYSHPNTSICSDSLVKAAVATIVAPVLLTCARQALA